MYQAMNIMNANNNKLPFSAGTRQLFSCYAIILFEPTGNLWDVKAPPHSRGKQGVYVEQCQRIMKGTLLIFSQARVVHISGVIKTRHWEDNSLPDRGCFGFTQCVGLKKSLKA